MFAILLFACLARAFEVGNASFNPFKFEIWSDSKRLYLKGSNENRQVVFFDGKNLLAPIEDFYPLYQFESFSHSELSFRSFVAFFRESVYVNWSDLLDGIPFESGNMLLFLPVSFWDCLQTEDYAILWNKFSSHPAFGEILKKVRLAIISSPISGYLRRFTKVGEFIEADEILFTVSCYPSVLRWEASRPLKVVYTFFNPVSDNVVESGQPLYFVKCF